MENLKNLDLIKKLIVKYLDKKYNIHNVKFSMCPMDGYLNIELPTVRARFTVLPNKVWKDTQKHIDTVIEQVRSKDKLAECAICSETQPHLKLTGCAACYQKHCYKCLVNIIRANQGLCVCPFCKHTVGFEMPPMMVERFVNGLMEKSPYK